MSADILDVDLLDVVGLDVGVGVAVGRNRNGSAVSGQGGPVRSRGGSSGERWRSGPVRSLMAAVLRRAGPAAVAGRTSDYRAPRTWAPTAGSSPAALVSMARSELPRSDRRLEGQPKCQAGPLVGWSPSGWGREPPRAREAQRAV